MEETLLLSLRELHEALGKNPVDYILGAEEDDLSVHRIQTRRAVSSSAQWRRHPATVLRLALLHQLEEDADGVKARAWLEFSHAGQQWAAKQALRYPAIARNPHFLWRNPFESSTLPLNHGRPDAADVLDEWTRVPTENFATTRGGMGDAGGVDQVAVLYWEDGAASGGDPWSGLRIHLPSVVAAIAADAVHM